MVCEGSIVSQLHNLNGMHSKHPDKQSHFPERLHFPTDRKTQKIWINKNQLKTKVHVLLKQVNKPQSHVSCGTSLPSSGVCWWALSNCFIFQVWLQDSTSPSPEGTTQTGREGGHSGPRYRLDREETVPRIPGTAWILYIPICRSLHSASIYILHSNSAFVGLVLDDELFHLYDI